MSITQELIDLAEKLRDSHGQLSPASVLCQQASQLISNQDYRLRQIPQDNRVKFIAAAITGLCGREDFHFTGNYPDHAKLVDVAMDIGRIASRRSLGEDS